MAKKTVSATPAVTPAVPKKTNQAFPTLPCALVYFWAFALKAWENCKARLPRFEAEGGPRYSKEFVDGQIAYIKEIKALPNDRARRAPSRSERLALMAARQAVSDLASRLNKAIEYTWKDPLLVEVQRSAAGLVTFGEATVADWEAVASFIESANTFLPANLERMVQAGAMNAEFPGKFESVGAAFDTIWTSLQAKRQSAKSGTKEVAAGIVKIQEELNPMLSDALDFFKYEPALKELFVQETLLKEVRNGHPATVSGGTTLPATNPDVKKGKPLAGILVEVLDEPGKSATTNKHGRYKIQLAGGVFTLRFSGEGLVPVERQVTLDPGKGRYLDMVLEPAPVEIAPTATKEATPPPASVNEEFANAMKEVTALPTSNGVAALQNGHAVA